MILSAGVGSQPGRFPPMVGGLIAGALLWVVLAACGGTPADTGKIELALPTATLTAAGPAPTPTPSPTPTAPLAQLVASRHPWPMVDGSLHRFRRSSAQGPHGPGQVLWTLDVIGNIVAEPVVAEDGTVYVVTRSGLINAVSPTGERLWRSGVGNVLLYPAVLSEDGALYVASGKPGYTGRVVALDAVTGKQRWRHELSSGYGPMAPMILDADGNLVLVVGRQNAYQSPQPGYLLSLTPAGAERWRGLANVPFGARLVTDGYRQVWAGGINFGGASLAVILWLVNPTDGQALETLKPGGYPQVNPDGEPYFWEVRWQHTTDSQGNDISRPVVAPYLLQASPQGSVMTTLLDEEAAWEWGGGPWGSSVPVSGTEVLENALWDGAGWSFGYLVNYGPPPEEAAATPTPGPSPTPLTERALTVAALDGATLAWQLDLRIAVPDRVMRNDISEPEPDSYTPLALGAGRLYFCTYGGILYAIGAGQ